MQRLVLVSILLCANFSCYPDTFATPQRASIKALRNANLRRDGKRFIWFVFSIEKVTFAIVKVLWVIHQTPPPPILNFSNELRRHSLERILLPAPHPSPPPPPPAKIAPHSITTRECFEVSWRPLGEVLEYTGGWGQVAFSLQLRIISVGVCPGVVDTRMWVSPSRLWKLQAVLILALWWAVESNGLYWIM